MQENSIPLTLSADKAHLHLTGSRELLSAGMEGVVQVQFTCSEDWDTLSRIAVFSNGIVSVDVPESDWTDGVCIIPREVLAQAGRTVKAGLYGTDGENLVLPTVWCSLGRVEPGVVPACAASCAAERPLWMQLGRRMDALEAAQIRIFDSESAAAAEIAAVQSPVLLRYGGALLPLCLLDEDGAVFCGLRVMSGSVSAECVRIGAQGVEHQSIALNDPGLQSSAAYFTADTVDGALGELAEELLGLNALLGGGIV